MGAWPWEEGLGGMGKGGGCVGEDCCGESVRGEKALQNGTRKNGGCLGEEWWFGGKVLRGHGVCQDTGGVSVGWVVMGELARVSEGKVAWGAREE